jgi:hypothetical protein
LVRLDIRLLLRTAVLVEVGISHYAAAFKPPAELFRMNSIKSTHTILNHRLVWKYKSIKNPYISPNTVVTSVVEEDDNPVASVSDVQPIAPEYDEVYLSNRILAFERDGWKCTRCGSRENLQTHHIEPIPKGAFNPNVMHRLENLRTLCETCHHSLPKGL